MAEVLINETTLALIGNAIRNKNGTATTYYPSEMPQAITNIQTGAELPEEAYTITGDCQRKFANGGWDWFIREFGDKVHTVGITNADNMFVSSQVSKIPFDLVFDENQGVVLAQCFQNCSNLESLPNIIVVQPRNFYCFVSGCTMLREIPEQWAEGIGWDYVNTQTNWQYCRFHSFFSNCSSLRTIPKEVLKKMYGAANSSNAFGYMFGGCASLDEIDGLRGPNTTLTSNVFSGMFSTCMRLKRLVFDYGDDFTGDPRIQDWKSQTIDLSSCIGYTGSAQNNEYILNYNSGITSNNEVTDAASYESLKNSPDWFTQDVAYSRYNHDSVVETINSLPDTSSSGGTNTIKFNGESGSATDGGAINTLTEEEIAVATAKGWVVAFV